MKSDLPTVPWGEKRKRRSWGSEAVWVWSPLYARKPAPPPAHLPLCPLRAGWSCGSLDPCPCSGDRREGRGPGRAGGVAWGSGSGGEPQTQSHFRERNPRLVSFPDPRLRLQEAGGTQQGPFSPETPAYPSSLGEGVLPKAPSVKNQTSSSACGETRMDSHEARAPGAGRSMGSRPPAPGGQTLPSSSWGRYLVLQSSVPRDVALRQGAMQEVPRRLVPTPPPLPPAFLIFQPGGNKLGNCDGNCSKRPALPQSLPWVPLRAHSGLMRQRVALLPALERAARGGLPGRLTLLRGAALLGLLRRCKVGTHVYSA